MNILTVTHASDSTGELNMPEKANLLIVDDDEDMLETLSDVLQEKGYQTETAKTGKEAITKAEEHFFDVALIDIKLPDVTGIEVLQIFREKHPTMMNVMITAYATVQNAVDAVNLGADAYIMKPMDFKRFDQIVEECYEKQQKILKFMQKKSLDFMHTRASWMRQWRLLKREESQVLSKSSRRSKFEVQLDILKILSRIGPQKITHIMYRANVNCTFLKANLGLLIERNLIEARTLSKNKIVYTITDKGRRALNNYLEIKNVLHTVEIPNSKMHA